MLFPLLLVLASTLKTTSSSASLAAKSKSLLGFCEGYFYVPKSKGNCPHGFTFGNRVPKCVCVRGVYRMYMDNCQVADGFAEEVCMLMKDGDVAVRGVKLTKEPNWDRTALVCEKGTGSLKDWEYVPEMGKVKSTSSMFYTINGEAMVAKSTKSSGSSSSGMAKQDICVQKKQKSNDKVCLYKHADNVDIWTMDKRIDFIVKPECPAGFTWEPLRARRCFNPLTLLDSECQVPCSKENVREGPGSPGGTAVGGSQDADLDKNVTDPRPYFHHDNDYLDRKLNMYLMMQEIGVFNVTPTSNITHGPNRTFILYDIMKDIVKNFCPSRYVSRTWVEQIVDLFHNLHHGDIFKYENELNEPEFNWIRDILLRCKTNGSTIDLYTDVDPDKQCDGVPRATGYCNNSMMSEDKPACDDTVKRPIHMLSPPYNDYETKHFVPEVNWLVLDIVHVVCFPQFNESYRMFHLLEQTIEKLFTVRIKNYWYFPSWDYRTKARMLGRAADDYMFNMEVCAESAYSARAYAPHRLIRPDPLKYLKRRKRVAEHVSSSFDVQCAKTRSDFKFTDKCSSGSGGGVTHKPNSVKG